MKIALAVFVVVSVAPPSAMAQVDQQRAAEFFTEAQALCEKDAGRLWGVSFCAPMVIGDARTQTFATSQPPPDAPRPKLIGIINGPIEWGGTMWAATVLGHDLQLASLARAARRSSTNRSTSFSRG